MKLDLQNFAEDKGKLDWSIIKRATGETRVEHVMKHGKNDLQKKEHGVFYGNPIDKVNDAYMNKGNIKPVSQGGIDKYTIPYPNAGYAGGYGGQGQNLNNIMIITRKGTNKIITGYPSAN
ncbi:hypothetical protein [Cytobacillus horneckiae]|uniref:hypothetical protein n=1 Tax=Cytobacillus horneckiae TaxID=549687 RepID=UPI003D9A780A